MIDVSMIEICAEEGVYPELVFFILLFLYHNVYSRKNLSTSVEKTKNRPKKFLVVIIQVFSFEVLM